MTLTALALPRRKVPRVVLHVHETWGRGERALLGLVLRRVDDIVVVSSSVRDSLPAAHQGRARVIHNGFASLDERAPIPAEATAATGVCLLLASRWNSWKGHAEFLAAWNTASRPGDRLLILGAPPPIGDVIDVERLVATSTSTGLIELVGEVDDVEPYLTMCDAVVVPSTRPDPLPTIAIEAAAAGRAVIASRCGGLVDIVKHDQTGYLAPPGDIAAWSHLIGSLDRQRLVDMGKAARRHYESEFSFSAYSRSIRAVLLQGSPSGSEAHQEEA
jgi:glycosyltransferase involved in cell wall biosynthesis